MLPQPIRFSEGCRSVDHKFQYCTRRTMQTTGSVDLPSAMCLMALLSRTLPGSLGLRPSPRRSLKVSLYTSMKEASMAYSHPDFPSLLAASKICRQWASCRFSLPTKQPSEAHSCMCGRVRLGRKHGLQVQPRNQTALRGTIMHVQLCTPWQEAWLHETAAIWTGCSQMHM